MARRLGDFIGLKGRTMATPARTIVYNILDDRCRVYDLPPDRAVVAAYLDCEHMAPTIRPPLHADYRQCREYHRGFACGDWIAFKEDRTERSGGNNPGALLPGQGLG